MLEPLLPVQCSHQKGHPYKDHRIVLNGIFWVLCSGAPWRDVPERYGPWKTIYNRFNRWSKSGLLDLIFNRFLTILDDNGLIDWQGIALDGSSVRAHKAAAGAQKNGSVRSETHALGRSRGGFGTKIHLATNLSGIPLAVQISAGQDSKIQFVSQLLRQISVQRKNGFIKRTPKALLADKAYISQSFRNELGGRHIKVVIPDKCNTKLYFDGRVKFDKVLYRFRNVIEHCIGLLKEKRRISSRYEKTARNCLSMIKLGCILHFLMLIIN